MTRNHFKCPTSNYAKSLKLIKINTLFGSIHFRAYRSTRAADPEFSFSVVPGQLAYKTSARVRKAPQRIRTVSWAAARTLLLFNAHSASAVVFQLKTINLFFPLKREVYKDLSDLFYSLHYHVYSSKLFIWWEMFNLEKLFLSYRSMGDFDFCQERTFRAKITGPGF